MYWFRCSRCGRERVSSYAAGAWLGPLFAEGCGCGKGCEDGERRRGEGEDKVIRYDKSE